MVYHFLIKQQVDLADFVFMNILEYSQSIDLSYPIIVENWILMQPFPDEKSRLDDPIKPFTGTVKEFKKSTIYLHDKIFFFSWGVATILIIQRFFRYYDDHYNLYSEN